MVETLLLPFLLLLLFLSHEVLTTTVCPSSQDLVLTAGFVDIYVSFTNVLQATSDGGAILVQTLETTGGLRLVKLDSEGHFVWLGTHKADVFDGGWHETNAVAEDAGRSFIYVAGLVSLGVSYSGFIAKFNMANGGYVNSRIVRAGTNDSKISALLIDSEARLVFVGAYSTNSLGNTNGAWLGTVDKDTLEFAEETLLDSKYWETGKISKIIEDAGNYVLAGHNDKSQIWVLAVDRTTWKVQWELLGTATGSKYVSSFLKRRTGEYALLIESSYYNVTAEAGIVFVAAFRLTMTSITSMASVSANSATPLIMAGYNTTYSKSYPYDPSADCEYTRGQLPEYSRTRFLIASAHPGYENVAWISGCFTRQIYLGFAAKIQVTPKLVCGSYETSFWNRVCYASSSVAAGTCFGLCATCLIGNNIDACATVSSVAHSSAVTFFAGRCSTSGYHYNAASSSCASVTQTSCHPLCGGECIGVRNSSRCAHHCVGVAIEPYIDDSDLAHNVCKCKKGTAFSLDSGKCEVCHVLCGSGGCALPNNSSQCVDCIPSAISSSLTNSTYVKCACDSNFILSGTICAPCHVFCHGCTSKGDSTKCTSCANIPNIEFHGSECACPDDSSYESGMCVYNSSCHPLCNGRCILRNDPEYCVSGCNPTAIGTLLSSGLYSCRCPEKEIYNGTDCVKIIHAGCHVLCKEGCVETDNALRCVGCVEQRNVVSEMSLSAGIKNCSCASGTTLTSGTCAYSSGCHRYCNGFCTIQANFTSCLGCAMGITASSALSSTEFTSPVTCECPEGTAYFNETCVPIIKDSVTMSTSASASCHPLCGGACIVAHDRTKCVDSCSTNVSDVVITGTVDDVLECGCVNGTHIDPKHNECLADVTCGSLCYNCSDVDTCLRCPSDKEGMVLSGGKCICKVEYVMMAEGEEETKCADRSEAGRVQYLGDLLIATLVIISISTTGSALWKFLSSAQELLLLATINSRLVSRTLVSVFQACSFANFNLFAPLFSFFSPELRGQVGYNAIIDQFQYHPSILGKMFLVNARDYICVALISLAGLGICVILARRSAYFARLKDGYVFSGAIITVQACFIDVVLCAFVQISHFSLTYGSKMYALSCIVACLAYACEVMFVAVGVYFILTRQIYVLLSEAHRTRFGAFYAGLKGTKRAFATPSFHNLRVTALIFSLVFAANHPRVQASIYLVSAIAEIGWDLGARPYDKIMLSAQVVIMDLAKVIASVGYIVLSLESTTEKAATWVCDWEAAVIILGIAVGLVFVVLQLGFSVHEVLTKTCRQEEVQEKVRVVTNLPSDISLTQNTVTVRQPVINPSFS